MRNVRALAAGVVLVAALATGCGIRPTGVPVDAGGPASRTACPSPVQVPAAAATPSQSPPPARVPSPKSPSAKAGAGTPGSAPGAAAAGTPTDGLFSAVPSPPAGGTERPGCP